MLCGAPSQPLDWPGSAPLFRNVSMLSMPISRSTAADSGRGTPWAMPSPISASAGLGCF